MAKKQSTTKKPNKSDEIRQILEKNPDAKVKDVKTALHKRGVKASDALINKIKYGRRSSKRGALQAGARRNGSARASKADSIRDMLATMGAKARPRDVILALAERGIVVSSAQVSVLRKTQPRHRKLATVTTSHSVSLDHLMAAKTLVQRLGSIDVAREAINSLARLIEN